MSPNELEDLARKAREAAGTKTDDEESALCFRIFAALLQHEADKAASQTSR